MRKHIVLLKISLLSMFAVTAQRIDSLSNESKQQYLQYIKKQSTYKTIGLVFLGTGPALVLTAYLINVENGWNGTPKANGALITGLVATGLSPFLLIIAGDYKRSANLVLKREGLTSSILFHKPHYPAVSLRINF